MRAAVSERRFADAKQHRDGGQQHGRTLVVVAAAVGLMVLAQNALTLLGLRKRNNSTPPKQDSLFSLWIRIFSLCNAPIRASTDALVFKL